jgi:acylphosphatase
MSYVARLFTVHGRVQGVWFRDSTRREAERLGVQGHAINRPDGTVEVLAYGSARRRDP